MFDADRKWIWTAGEWLIRPPAGLSARTTDEQIERIALEIEHSAQAEGVTIQDDIAERLRGMRDAMRTPAPRV